MQQQLTLNLDLQTLYEALDENGKKVMLDVLTQGVGEGFVRGMLIDQWTKKEAPIESPIEPAIS